jgi:DNA-binding NtrC family response regulator
VSLDLKRKRVLILSDNAGLSRAIALNLDSRLEVETVRFEPKSAQRGRRETRSDGFDLMIVAMSSPTSEPIVALARASLAVQIGQIPLLIISNRPFDSTPEDRITYLDFPFDIDRLCYTVRKMLHL